MIYAAIQILDQKKYVPDVEVNFRYGNQFIKLENDDSNCKVCKNNNLNCSF